MSDAIRIAVRTLRKQPGFSSVVILSLALAISLNTTMYSVLDAFVHPRIDIRDADQLWSIRLYGDNKFRVPTPERDSALRSAVHNITAITREVAFGSNAVFQSGRQLFEGSIAFVQPNYFEVLGPRVAAGRTFIPADSTADVRPLVLGEALAHQLFPRMDSPLGERVVVDTSTYVVVGVLSRYAEFPDSRISAYALAQPNRTGREGFNRLIRLRPGASPQDAARELRLVADRIASAAGEDPKYVDFRFKQPARPDFTLQRLHIALIVAVFAVLLVACANLANMQLARGIGRSRELALRAALGASRRRIVSHLLLESALLALAGLALGLVLTYWSAAALAASIPKSVGQYVVEPSMSWRVLAFAAVATLACLGLVGVAPAIRVSRVDPNDMLKNAAGTGATRRNRRQYGYLVGIEIALSLALLSGATIMVRSSLRMNGIQYGFDYSHVATGVFTQRFTPGESRPTSEVLQLIATRAGTAVGAVSATAYLSQMAEHNAVTVSDSGRGLREIPAPQFSYRVVTSSYTRTFGLRITEGRDFRDGERDEPAVIIDEYTARVLWPNGNPIGAQMKMGDGLSNAPFVRIVGVASNVMSTGRRPADLASVSGIRVGMVLYLPGRGDSTKVPQYGRIAATALVRGSGDISGLPIAMRRVGSLRAQTMDEQFGISRARISREFIAKLFSLFAVLGIGLAAFGVYGIVAHSVAERRRELGVRIALGASARDILHAVLRESLAIALAGMALGLLGTKYGVKLLEVMVFEDDLYNAPLFAGAALFLAAVAAASALVPALRATRVDPTESLRCE